MKKILFPFLYCPVQNKGQEPITGFLVGPRKVWVLIFFNLEIQRWPRETAFHNSALLLFMVVSVEDGGVICIELEVKKQKKNKKKRSLTPKFQKNGGKGKRCRDGFAVRGNGPL
jgi:hypothetical protein